MEYLRYEAHVAWTQGHHRYESMNVLTIHESSLDRLMWIRRLICPFIWRDLAIVFIATIALVLGYQYQVYVLYIHIWIFCNLQFAARRQGPKWYYSHCMYIDLMSDPNSWQVSPQLWKREEKWGINLMGRPGCNPLTAGSDIWNTTTRYVDAIVLHPAALGC